VKQGHKGRGVAGSAGVWGQGRRERAAAPGRGGTRTCLKRASPRDLAQGEPSSALTDPILKADKEHSIYS
jgi:hypothetical protein